VPKWLTTAAVARHVGIDRATLQDWIRTGRVRPPALKVRNGRTVRLWSQRDIERLRAVKAASYRRGRGRKAASIRHVGRRRKSPNPTGRPIDIDPQTLVQYRDVFLGLLSQAWGDVGFNLPRASTIEEVRAALRPLAALTLQWFRLTPFLHEPVIPVTRSELRRSRRSCSIAADEYASAASERQSAKDRFDQSRTALNTATGDDGALRTEHFRRLQLCLRAEREYAALHEASSAAQANLVNQTAFYVQTELLSFVCSPRRYARNPPNFAGAMAGLPEVTASYGFQRCSMQPNPSWPFLAFRIFHLIEQAWLRAESMDALAVALSEAIRGLAADDPVRRQLAAEWRYVRQAIEEVSTEGRADPEAKPFQVFAMFWKKRAAARTHDETVRVQMEQLEPTS
jgi:hypothetical protein